MLAAASVLVGCVQDVGESVLPLEVEEAGIPYEIYALSSDTKTVNSGMSTCWEAGDRISVFHAESGSDDYIGDGAFCLTEENVSSDLFTGVLARPLDADTYDWYFIYPYSGYMTSPAVSAGHLILGSAAGQPQHQKGKDNMHHIAGEAYPMYAAIKDVPADVTPSGIMNHMTSLVAVNVINRTGAPMKVSSAGIRAAEPVTGRFFIDITGEEAEYIPFDKDLKNGVKDLVFDLEAKTVTVTYDANKTDVPAIQKAFAKIGKPATTNKPCNGHEHSDACQHNHHEHHGHQH